MVKIVVLDGAGVNPGDLSWEPLSEAGDLTVYPRTEPGETVERAASAHIILTESAPLTQEMIAQLPQLRCIMVMATGYDHVDSRAAYLRNIPVCNVPGYGTEAVAQMDALPGFLDLSPDDHRRLQRKRLTGQLGCSPLPRGDPPGTD